MLIKDAEDHTGITKKTIRFYEDKGLLRPKRNAQSGYRDYSESDMDTLKKIKILRILSVPLEEIRLVQQGNLSLAECMKQHEVTLKQQVKDLMRIQEVCSFLASKQFEFSNMDILVCESCIAEADNKI